MLSRACESSAAAKPCNHSTDLEGFLAPTSLNVSGVGNISVPFGTDPADAVAAFGAADKMVTVASLKIE